MYGISLQTVNCIVTGKPARCWSGHVVARERIKNPQEGYADIYITAGFVDRDTHDSAELAGANGYYGEWKPADGIQLWSSWVEWRPAELKGATHVR